MNDNAYCILYLQLECEMVVEQERVQVQNLGDGQKKTLNKHSRDPKERKENSKVDS